MEKRVFLIVLDSFGIGAEPDAAAFGDEGTNTLGAIAQHPTNIPPRIPNTAANIFPPGMDMWNTQKIFASIPPSATLSS